MRFFNIARSRRKSAGRRRISPGPLWFETAETAVASQVRAQGASGVDREVRCAGGALRRRERDRLADAVARRLRVLANSRRQR